MEYLKEKLQHYHETAISMENIKKDEQQRKADENPQMFREDELVLLKRMRYLKGKSPKLMGKWTGPFAIYKTLSNNAYMLKGIIGKILKHPVNYDRLKKYYNMHPYLAIIEVGLAPDFQDLQQNDVYEV